MGWTQTITRLTRDGGNRRKYRWNTHHISSPDHHGTCCCFNIQSHKTKKGANTPCMRFSCAISDMIWPQQLLQRRHLANPAGQGLVVASYLSRGFSRLPSPNEGFAILFLCRKSSPDCNWLWNVFHATSKTLNPVKVEIRWSSQLSKTIKNNSNLTGTSQTNGSFLSASGMFKFSLSSSPWQLYIKSLEFWLCKHFLCFQIPVSCGLRQELQGRWRPWRPWGLWRSSLHLLWWLSRTLDRAVSIGRNLTAKACSW